MFRSLRRIAVTVCGAGVISAGVLIATTGAAYAYGNSGGNVQLYQASISQNCDNVSVCGPSLGGFWAWGEFGEVTSTGALVFDAEATGCSHFVNNTVPGASGAQHEQISGTWEIAENGGVPWIVITSETDTFDGGPMNGRSVTVPSEFMPIGPAMKAHLDTAEALGFTAPGVSFNVTVTPMHH